MRNQFMQLDEDFGSNYNGDIETIYPRNPFDNDKADSIFGLGNKQKKAEKKIRKAEKQLAKGHVAKAEKKIAKAAKKLGEGDLLKQTISAQGKSILAGRPLTSTTNVSQTENVNTDAGQIGSQAQPPTDYSYPSGGARGGIGGGDQGYSPETGLTAQSTGDTEESDIPTGDMATTKDMEDVTVTGNKGLQTWVVLIGVAVVILAVWYFSKKKK